jgi:hypothetical protein
MLLDDRITHAKYVPGLWIAAWLSACLSSLGNPHFHPSFNSPAPEQYAMHR